jgi:hypothetical protein
LERLLIVKEYITYKKKIDSTKLTMKIKNKQLSKKQEELDRLFHELRGVLNELGIEKVPNQDLTDSELEYYNVLECLLGISQKIEQERLRSQMTKELDFIVFLKNISTQMKNLALRLDHIRFNKEIPFQARCYKLQAKTNT